ncbi:MAG: right-handed parallel beta-helix repeat-containing protein [Candidatus Omnitrophica bacterium]|nr:right-handed parallel beta-helix repeat-containing protein [Candidatus Omnitrophota bacterium]
MPRLKNESNSLLRSRTCAAAILIGSCLSAAFPALGVTFRWASTSDRIYVTGPGLATLSDISVALPHAPLAQSAPGVWQLRANILIQQGASLILHGAAIGGDVDELRLQSNNSSAANSYVWISADWGSIDIQSTKITSWDDAANGPDTEYATYGRAYIRVRSSLASDGVTPRESRMDIINSEVCYLGFHGSEAYGLVWKVIGSQPNLYDLVNVYGNIQNSHIHDNYFGVYTYGAYQMQIQTNEFDHNAKYGLDPHDDSDSLLIEGNYSHHNGDHGIIASKRCDHLIIRNNISEFNTGNGIMLHRSSDDGTIEGNLCQNNTDCGIALFDVRGTTVRGNQCLDNGTAGIRLSVGSADSVIENNESAGNQKYGLYFYKGGDAPRAGDDGRPKRNQFNNNSIHDNLNEGVKLSDADDNSFAGNQFFNNGPVLRFIRGTGNMLDGNDIPLDVTVKTQGSSSSTATTFIRNQPLINVQVDSYSSVTFEDDNGAVFDPQEQGVATTVTPTGSMLLLTSANIGASTAVATRHLLVVPDSGSALVDPTIWNFAFWRRCSSVPEPYSYAPSSRLARSQTCRNRVCPIPRSAEQASRPPKEPGWPK